MMISRRNLAIFYRDAITRSDGIPIPPCGVKSNHISLSNRHIVMLSYSLPIPVSKIQGYTYPHPKPVNGLPIEAGDEINPRYVEDIINARINLEILLPRRRVQEMKAQHLS